MLYHNKHPFEPQTVISPPGSPHPDNACAVFTRAMATEWRQPRCGNPDSGIHTASVPEPASGVLGLTALVAGLVAASRCSRTKIRERVGSDSNG